MIDVGDDSVTASPPVQACHRSDRPPGRPLGPTEQRHGCCRLTAAFRSRPAPRAGRPAEISVREQAIADGVADLGRHFAPARKLPGPCDAEVELDPYMAEANNFHTEIRDEEKGGRRRSQLPHHSPRNAPLLRELIRIANDRGEALSQGRRDRSGGEVQCLWKTMEEIALGKTARQGLRKEEHGDFGNCTKRHEIQQDNKADGSAKCGAIDDHTESCKNLAAGGKQKILMATTTTVMNMVARVARHLSDRGESDSAPPFATPDIKSVYRQVPLVGQLAISIHDHHLKRHRGQGPVPRALQETLRRGPCCAELLKGRRPREFFDDHLLVEPASRAHNAA